MMITKKSILVCVCIPLFFSCGNETTTHVENLIDTASITSNADSTQNLTTAVKGDYIYAFYDYENTSKYGLKNKKGEIVLKPVFDCMGIYTNGKVPVIKDNKHGFADINGNTKWLNDYTFETSSNEMSGEVFIKGNNEELVLVRDPKGMLYYFNYSMKKIIDCSNYDDAFEFSTGLAIVVKNNKYGFIDRTGKLIIPLAYDNLNSFYNGLARFSINNKYGYLSTKGNKVIPAIYFFASNFSEGLSFVSKNEDYTDYFYIDTAGKIIIKGPFDQADSFINGKTIVGKDGNCKEIDKTGKTIKKNVECPQEVC